ncbi:MAG: TlpA disulfide reductase family protein [Chloroflexota bacterium]
MSENQQSQQEETTPISQPIEEGKINPVLVIFLIVPLLSIIAALGMVAMDMQSQRAPNTNAVFENTNPATLINSQAPEFELTDLNGQAVRISDYEGKILFLNFWQTTCPPCIEEMPDFLDFIADQPDDVTWLTVNFDETDQQVREFFAEYEFLGIPTVMDYDSEVRYRYGVFGAPVTFVLDKDGTIQYMNIGQLSYDDMEQLVNAVREEA